MTPITKNIRVIDEKGNHYEATYPKRARGLVKNGRARFIDENTICLACPPKKYLEDKYMDNNFNIDDTGTEITEEINRVLQENPQADDLPLSWVLERIDKIMNETEHLKYTRNALDDIAPAAGPGDIVGQAKAQALGDIVRCRETTNQQMLRLLEKMYDDLKPQKAFTPPIVQLRQIMDEIISVDWDKVPEEIRGSISSGINTIIVNGFTKKQ